MEHKKTVGVIGYGYVGQAVANFFKDKFDVRIYDAYKPEYSDKTKVTNVDLAVICVPTPMSETGHCDTSIVEDVISWVNAKNILIKSTIPPGTTAGLIKKTGKQICFSPEYIGEGKYEVPFWKGYPDPTDMKKHDFVIIGGEAGARSEILSFFKRVLGAEPRYFQTDTTTAELCKYMENAFLATKVIFVNEFYDIAQSFNVDFNELREMWLADGRIGRSHTQVFEDGRGFSGKCLPKDVNAIVHASMNNGYTPELLKSVLEVNTKMNTKSKRN